MVTQEVSNGSGTCWAPLRPSQDTGSWTRRRARGLIRHVPKRAFLARPRRLPALLTAWQGRIRAGPGHVSQLLRRPVHAVARLSDPVAFAFPTDFQDSQTMNTTNNKPHENTSRMVCLAMISISWATLIANVVVNVRNGQRLSIDDYGWFLNTLIIGMLSIAPTACLAFTGYGWRRGRRILAVLAALGAIPLVFLNLWSVYEYVGDQMLGKRDRVAAEQQLANESNAEVMRSKRDAEERLWKAWNATRDPTERASIMREINKVRAEAPSLKASSWAGALGSRSEWLSHRLGWSKESIDGVTPMMVPTLMQMVELLFSFLGFSLWPRKQVVEQSGMFGNVRAELQSEHRRKFTYDDAVRDIAQLRATGGLDRMKSKTAFGRRWGVPKTTAWEWLQKIQAHGVIKSVPTGEGNATSIRAVNGSDVKHATRIIDPITSTAASKKENLQ